MNDVISEVVGILKHSLSKKIAIQQELSESLPNVKGDRGQLTQVIMNLCLNAADAMNEGDGEILMRTESRPLTERERNTLLDVGGGSYICITVADNGMGMDEHVRKHIFDPFFTTKAGQGGSGLGLSIVYGIVNNHQGEISLESEAGAGTTFRIYLPVFLGEKVETETIEEPPARGNETVLIIDDEQIVREMVAAILKDFGYTAITASGGEEGLEKLKEAEGAVDLVLLDMVMPGMDGPQTFDAIKAKWAQVPVLLTTGFAEGDQCIRLMDAGARGLVRKPYKSRDLLKTVRKVLNDVRRERVAKSKGGA
jgi:CheY-like chemotaxis protein